MQIGVLGAGVIGLTTARLLQAGGHEVTIHAVHPPLATTSAKAGASVKPHAVPDTPATEELLRRSWPHFGALSAEPASGVRWHTHWEAGSLPLGNPGYLAVMHDVRDHTFPNVPGGYAFGRSYGTYLVDMPVHLTWLLASFRSNGGGFVLLPRPLRDLGEVAALPHEIVLNCTGLGARELCDDAAVFALRGQVALVGPQPQLDYSISADGFYVYPRSADTVIGGTAEPGVELEEAEPATISVLLRAARRILPTIGEADVLRALAGLRPCRTGAVRIEVEDVASTRIVHNYGHGGSGVTLSWGSAERAVELATG